MASSVQLASGESPSQNPVNPFTMREENSSPDRVGDTNRTMSTWKLESISGFQVVGRMDEMPSIIPTWRLMRTCERSTGPKSGTNRKIAVSRFSEPKESTDRLHKKTTGSYGSKHAEAKPQRWI